MVCIYCAGPTAVTNSRYLKNFNSTWRRRLCQNCHAIFTTRETPDFAYSLRVLKNDKLVNFNEDILFISIYSSLKHRLNPLEDARDLVTTITNQLLKINDNGLLSIDQISLTALNVLKNFDQVAYVHYQAFHRIS